MKILFCFLALFFLGCAVVPDLPAEAPGGDVAIQLKNRQLTACRRICAGEDGKTAFRKINNQLYCPEAAFCMRCTASIFLRLAKKSRQHIFCRPRTGTRLPTKPAFIFIAKLLSGLKIKNFCATRGFAGQTQPKG